ncbi:MAG: hypothetical protein GY847_23580 [Proteobacteria bacterium]|nr:hypothetical protein [Pseudomonadota bacterium]
MVSRYSDWQYWILQNLALLSKRYGKDGVVLNGKTWRSILIFYYKLPPFWTPRTSRLLIVLPPKSKVFYAPPDRFYLDLGLQTFYGQKPAHYFEIEDFNDMAKHGMARFSFHLKNGWNPRVQCQQGTTLVDVIDALYAGLDSAAKEVTQ